MEVFGLTDAPKRSMLDLKAQKDHNTGFWSLQSSVRVLLNDETMTSLQPFKNPLLSYLRSKLRSDKNSFHSSKSELFQLKLCWYNAYKNNPNFISDPCSISKHIAIPPVSQIIPDLQSYHLIIWSSCFSISHPSLTRPLFSLVAYLWFVYDKLVVPSGHSIGK